VVAFNVGLFENANGFSAYLMGSDCYDPDDSNWACEESFTPSERYFSVQISDIAGRAWEHVHQAVAEATRAFLQSLDGKGSCREPRIRLTGRVLHLAALSCVNIPLVSRHPKPANDKRNVGFL
jgi:hypothetical protein